MNNHFVNNFLNLQLINNFKTAVAIQVNNYTNYYDYKEYFLY